MQQIYKFLRNLYSILLAQFGIIFAILFAVTHFCFNIYKNLQALKVLPFKIPKPEQETLVYQEDYEMVFYDQLHQHQEIQISYVAEGSGTLIIGDTINNYQKDDVIIIGENIPHVFKSDRGTSAKSHMLSLFFTKNAFGKNFFLLSEFEKLQNLFEESQYGLRALSNKPELKRRFRNLKEQNKVERIASLLLILNVLVHAKKESLSSFVYRKKYSDDDGKRMRAVLEYAMKNYDQSISLDTIADKANMSKNAFCRYFKKRTNKTFFQFLIEIRIENACKLLYNKKELPISSISELCGFQNIANFNRKFKELKGITPSQYRGSVV